MATTGIAIGGPALFGRCKREDGMEEFPFYRFVEKYSVGEYIPKDQGGKFIQQEILGTENDELIVGEIYSGLLQKVYGNPIGWGKLEKTELEKSVWLNRFYYLPSFARLYYLTGEKRHLDFMMQFIIRWIDENPHVAENKQSKYNWYDMQVAWRAIHLSWCYYLTEKVLMDNDKQVIVNLQKKHAEILLSHFGEQPLNEFNHQSHGALAMLYLGVLFPDLPDARNLIDTAMKILDHHINHAFYDDGGNVEQMFGYYPFQAHIFRDTLLLCKSNGIPLSENLTALLYKMVHYISSVAQPDGTMPPVNDSYPMPVKTILETLADALDTDFMREAASSAYFPDTQVGVFRTTTGENDWYIMMNPAMTIGAHAHAGRLAFNLWYNGHPFVVESGCCNYDNPLLKSWYRRSEAHNTVLIDDKSDEATSKPVQWAPKRTTGNRIAEWIEEPCYMYCRMVSPASEPSNSGVIWTRKVVIVKKSLVIVYDHFDSHDEHDYEILFHLPDVLVQEDKETKSFLLQGTRSLALLPSNKNVIIETSIKKGLVNISGVDTPTPLISCKLRGGEVHLAMIFCPVNQSVSEIKIEQQISDEGLGLLIEDSKNEKHICIFRHCNASSANFWGHSTSGSFAVF